MNNKNNPPLDKLREITDGNVAEGNVVYDQPVIPVANPFNIAIDISEALRVDPNLFFPTGFQNVTSIDVYTVSPSDSGKSAAFTIVMAGQDLNKDSTTPYDTRRVFTVRVSRE